MEMIKQTTIEAPQIKLELKTAPEVTYPVEPIRNVQLTLDEIKTISDILKVVGNHQYFGLIQKLNS